ncbi:SusC/RagA family TonB-linked outer membrane protein [Marinifilum sp.]|uniref:SusC/RagA family TonB-linked outer membrane protein n=1 Tax=Marinifilum sp. TaxID=2033137 RepID=UPI003BAC099B
MIFNKIIASILLVLIIQLLSITKIQAQSSDPVVSLQLEEASLKQVFENLGSSTGFTFHYTDNILNDSKKYSFKIMKQPLSRILEQISKRAGFAYEIVGKKISINKLEKKAITGKIKDAETGEELVGVTIRIKGTTDGTISDINGDYSFLAYPNSTIQFSYIGYVVKEEDVNERNSINISLSQDITNLDEVVVTALGISREKKGLGYAVQEIQGQDMNEARETNFINGLAGKVAGVQISSSGAVGSSSRINIRGENSLNFGANSPLYIVDGVPVGNSGTSNSTSSDYGNSAAEINPADIESLTVLKGAAASALYGSRAGNGVIVITTKSGKDSKGLGVSINSGFTFEEVLRLPKFQNEFGQGKNGDYEGSNFGASWSIYPDGNRDGYDESWGPRLNVGTLERQFQSPTIGRMRGGDVANPNREEVIPTPWIAYKNNIKDFFDTGQTRFNNISLTGSNENGSFRFSYTNLDQKGIVPNNDLQRNTFALKSSYQFTDKFSADVSMNYINTTSTNRPETGYGRHSLMYFMNWMPRNVDINALRDYWQIGFEGSRQFQYNYGENHNNPFFYQYENTKGQDKHRLYGNVKLNYDFTSNLSLMLRAGTDYYQDFRPMRWAVSTVGVEKGRYREVNQYFQERNYDFLLRYNNNIGKFKYIVSVGGNKMEREIRNRLEQAPELLIPGIYSLANSASEIVVGSYSSEKEIHSLYGLAQLDYANTYYMDITARNDWSSTLPLDNNSYFYKSVSFSALINQIVDMPVWVNQVKVRLGAAEAGNDTEPYNLYDTFSFQPAWGTTYSLSSSSVMKNNKLKPEEVTTLEVGGDIKLLNNRFGVDFTFYDTRTRNQIINIPLTQSTGKSSRFINAGEVQSKGIELMVNATPIKTRSGFEWNIGLNYSRNQNKIIELVDGIDAIVQTAPGEDASIQARVGEKMGAIWGPGYQRVDDVNSPLHGEIIIFENGRPKPTSDDIYLGNFNPDWTGSVSNTFRYKNFSLATLVDIHWGGEFISRFYNKAMGAGQLKESAIGRSARPVGEEYGDYYIAGAAALSDGTYVANSTSADGTYSEGVHKIDARYFHKGFLDHISEGQLFDATYVKLREVKLAYKFPNKLFNDVVKDVQLSLVGRNLFLWTPDSNQHFDPEVSTATTGNGLIPGFENMSLPSTRSYGFNLSLKF